MTAKRFLLVENPEDTPADHQRIMALHAPAHGRVVVELPGDVGGTKGLACAGLRAIGRSKGIPAATADCMAALVSWLDAGATDDLIFTRGHLAQPSTIGAIGLVGAVLGARVTLVCQAPPGKAATRQLARWAEDTLQFEGWLECAERELPPLHEPDPLATSATSETPADDLPKTNFTTFRADLKAGVGEAEFEALDAAYSSAAREMIELCMRDYQSNSLQPSDIAAWFDTRFSHKSVASRLSILRGAQAGAFVSGVLLAVNVDRLLYKISEDERGEISAEEIGRLASTEMQPDRAALLVLLFATSAGAEALAGLEANQVRPATLQLRIKDTWRDLGPACSKPINALLTYNSLRSTRGSARWLFLGPDGLRYEARGVRAVLRELAGRTPKPVDVLGEERRLSRNWMYRHGLTMIRFAGCRD